MKALLYALSLTVLFSACQSNTPEVVAIPVQETVQEVRPNADAQLFISGMTCVMGCKGAIEKQLNKTAGISEFEIVFEDSTALVQFDSTLIEIDEIVSAVNAVAGGGHYTATVLKPSAE